MQNALAASAARAAARTPELAELVRKQQDLHKQVLAQSALLNNVLAAATRAAKGGLVKGSSRSWRPFVKRSRWQKAKFTAAFQNMPA